MDKVEIIRQISRLHPSNGVEKGWSSYTGGMADTGCWNFWKMYDDVSQQDLQLFLDEQNAIHQRIRNEVALFDSLSQEDRDKIYEESLKSQDKNRNDFFNTLERKLMWGK